MLAEKKPSLYAPREIATLALWLVLFLSCMLLYALMYVRLGRSVRGDKAMFDSRRDFPRYLYHGN